MNQPTKRLLPRFFFVLGLSLLTACSSAPTAEPTAEPTTTEETSLEGTRVYGGGYSFVMPAGWVQAPGDDAILVYEEGSQGLNAFYAVGFTYDGADATDEEMADTRKKTSDYYYEKYFKDEPNTTLITEGLEFTSFGTTYTLLLDSAVDDGTNIYPVGTEQWVYVDREHLLRFQGSWEKGNAEAENTVIDILFSVEVD